MTTENWTAFHDLLFQHRIYLTGVLGSVVVEILAAYKSSLDLQGHCPERYKRPFFIAIRTALAIAAGSIPVMVDATTTLNAFILGAGAPVFVDKLGKGVRTDMNGQNGSGEE